MGATEANAAIAFLAVRAREACPNSSALNTALRYRATNNFLTQNEAGLFVVVTQSGHIGQPGSNDDSLPYGVCRMRCAQNDTVAQIVRPHRNKLPRETMMQIQSDNRVG